MKYVILIPAYNPDGGMINLVENLKRYFDYIVVVNDGSQEKYARVFSIVKEICILEIHYVNQGKGRAIKTGINRIIGLMKEHPEEKWGGVITVDADGQHTVEDILKVKEKMDLNGDKIILGARDFSGHNVPLRSRFGNTLTKYIMKWLCGLNLKDTQTGLRGIPIQFLKTLCAISGERYEYETNCLIVGKQTGIEFDEVPIKTIYENQNVSSHFNPVKDSYMIYKMIFAYSVSSMLSVVIDFLIFAICTGVGLNVWGSTALSRAGSCVINFSLNKRAVFKVEGNTVVQFLKYIVLVIISGAISATIINLLKDCLPLNIIIIKAVVETCLFFFNYYVQRVCVFTK